MNRLYENFNSSERTQALNGLGGIGKTQTAVEYVYRHRQDYEVVLWSGANTRETLVADYAAIASLLDLPEKNAQDQGEAVAAVKRWLENNSNWLLILDNADEIEIAEEFIPMCETGHVLLTTRAHAIGTVGESNALEKMSPKEGAIFLLRRLRKVKKDEGLKSATPEICAQAEALSTLVDGLPLALDQAAAFIEETPSTLEEYQTLYQSERQELLKRRGKLAEDHPSVTVTFSLAFKKVADANPAAADLLRVCAFLEADSIPEEIFREGAKQLGDALSSAAESSLALTDAIREAARFSLLRRQPEGRTLSLHRLVQAVLKDEMEEVDKRLWAERAVRAVNEVFPVVEYSNWPLCNRLIPHAQLLVSLIEEYNLDLPEAARILNRAGYYLRARTQYTEAESLLKRSLVIRERVYRGDHPDVAQSLNDLALLYSHHGRHAEAEPLAMRALTIREKMLGAEHLDVAQSLNNLAWVYFYQGRHAEAEPLSKRALAIREKSLGKEHVLVATSLINLAWIYIRQEKYEDAELLLKRALVIRKKTFGLAHPLTANSLEQLAILYESQGRLDEAESLYKNALEINERALGAEHLDTTNIRYSLAVLYDSQGRCEDAKPLFEQTLAIYEKTFGQDHRSVARLLGHYASSLRAIGKESEAEKLENRASIIRAKYSHQDLESQNSE